MNSTGDADLLTNFGIADYAMSAIMLTISLGIGIYFGIWGSKSTSEYLTAGGKMKTLPVAISLAASQISGVSIIGVAAEVYAFGTQIYMCCFGVMLGTLLAIYVFVPVFFNLGLSNAFEYLEMRFDKKVRKMMALLFLLHTYLFIPVIIFVPSLSFSQVTGVNIHVANSVVICICVMYTMLGGIKAVIWTDVIQAVVIFISCIIVLIIAVINVGGIDTIVQRASSGERLQFFNISLNLTERTTFWNQLIGNAISWAGYVGLNQSCVQRYATVPKYKNAKTALFTFMIGFMIVVSLTTGLGLVMYATYFNCDPIKSGVVLNPDKLVSHFVQNTVRHFPGMLGLFIAGIFSASLSTMSAAFNSAAAIVYQDFVKEWNFFEPTDANAKTFMKIVVILSGVFSILAGFAIENFGLLIQMASTILGVTMGTTMGIYILGMLIPIANKLGALIGGITSIVVMVWMFTGCQIALITKMIIYEPLSTSVEGCTTSNLTHLDSNASILSESTPSPGDTFILYRLSFHYYSLLGMLITVITGIIVSLITGRPDPRSLGSHMFSPSIRWLLPKEMLTDKIEDDDQVKNQNIELQEIRSKNETCEILLENKHD